MTVIVPSCKNVLRKQNYSPTEQPTELQTATTKNVHVGLTITRDLGLEVEDVVCAQDGYTTRRTSRDQALVPHSSRFSAWIDKQSSLFYIACAACVAWLLVLHWVMGILEQIYLSVWVGFVYTWHDIHLHVTISPNSYYPKIYNSRVNCICGCDLLNCHGIRPQTSSWDRNDDCCQCSEPPTRRM